MRASNNAIAANRMVDIAAASGKYDTRDYLAVKAALASGVKQPQPPSAIEEKNLSPSRQRAPASQALRDESSSVTKNTGANVSQIQLFQPVNDVQVVSRFENPNVPPREAASFLSSDIDKAVASLSLAALSPKTEEKSPAAVFVTSVLESARKREAAERSSDSGPNAPDSSQSDKNRQSSVSANQTAPAVSNGVAVGQGDSDWQPRELTPEQKEALKDFIKGKLEAAANQATPDALEKEEPEKREFLAAIKKASREPSILDKLADDVAGSVQSLAVNDRQINMFLSRKAAERARERMAKAFLESGQQPVRAVASGKNIFFDWELDFSNGRGLILLAIASIFVALLWNSRSNNA